MPWSSVTLAGHACDVFDPVAPNPHGFVLIYLHGIHLNRLVDQPVFTAEFERHGLHVVAPFTAHSWWTDKICTEFDPVLTAERHVLDNVIAYVNERYHAEPPRIGLLGTSMGGQG